MGLLEPLISFIDDQPGVLVNAVSELLGIVFTW